MKNEIGQIVVDERTMRKKRDKKKKKKKETKLKK